MKTDWTSLSDGEIWDRIAGNLSPAEYHGDDTDLTLSPASVLEMWGNDPDVTEADATIISEALRRHVRGAATRQRGEGEREMLHEVFGNNFHGDYHLRFRGPAEGFVLSPGQARRYRDALCGVSNCTCGGGYGTGPGEASAIILQAPDEFDADCKPVLRLHPAH